MGKSRQDTKFQTDNSRSPEHGLIGNGSTRPMSMVDAIRKPRGNRILTRWSGGSPLYLPRDFLALVLILFAVGLVVRTLFMGGRLIGQDATVYFAPMFDYLGDRLRPENYRPGTHISCRAHPLPPTQSQAGCICQQWCSTQSSRLLLHQRSS